MIHTTKNKIIHDGKQIFIRGVSIPGFEYLYVDIDAMIDETLITDINVIRSWGFNTIRIPLRDYHWFNTNRYQERIDFIIQQVMNRDMYIILDLHTQQHNPYMDSFMLRQDGLVLRFWKDIATKYKNNPRIFFEIFNEPHDITPDIWWHGNNLYFGYKEILQNIRHIANNICIIGGLDYAYQWSFLNVHQDMMNELSGIQNILLSSHPYGYRGLPKADLINSQQIPVYYKMPDHNSPSTGNCKLGISIPEVPYPKYGWNESFGYLHISQKFPMITTEFGLDHVETALQGGWYVIDLLRYLNTHKISYVAWAWVKDRIDYPSLIGIDYAPTGQCFLDEKGPACGMKENGFYKGLGFLIHQDLKKNHHLLFIKKDDKSSTLINTNKDDQKLLFMDKCPKELCIPVIIFLPFLFVSIFCFRRRINMYHIRSIKSLNSIKYMS